MPTFVGATATGTIAYVAAIGFADRRAGTRPAGRPPTWLRAGKSGRESPAPRPSKAAPRVRRQDRSYLELLSILTLYAGGGTKIHRALAEATGVIGKSKLGRRHIILLLWVTSTISRPTNPKLKVYEH
jgi:hypothetical protein